jgi:flagellar export protein FliJ
VSSSRGDVVVRVRTIAENIASAEAAAAAVTAGAAADAAAIAARRARVHPLAGSRGALAASDLMTAVGTASALRESALTASRRAALAQQTLEDSRRNAQMATARRKAAERLVERRMAIVNLEAQRRDQRRMDENAAHMKREP